MPALDGLRAVAVIGVILFHGGYLRGGYLGVDLFFVLSGFLITSLLLKEPDGVRLVRFWSRRARRLLPALLLLLAAVAGYAAFLAAPTELQRIRGDSWATLLYYANWHAVLAEQRYWDLFSTPSPLAHTWSLAIEEQFYLIWPLCVAAIMRARRAKRALLIFSLAVGTLTLAWMAYRYVPNDATSRVYFGSDTRASALALGAALAAGLALRSHPPKHKSEAGAWVGAGILAVCWWHIGGSDAFLYRGGFLICQLAVVLLLLGASHPQAGWLARGLSLTPLTWIGKLSYGLYLWHWPVFVALSEARVGVDGVRLFAVRVAVSVGLAAASFYALERPIRRGAVGGKRMWALAPASFLIVAGLNYVSTEPRQAVAGERAWLTVSAERQNRAAPLSLMLVGDSVAERLAMFMTPLAERLGVQMSHVADAGCGVFPAKARLRLPNGKVAVPGRNCAPLPKRWHSKRKHDVALLVFGAPALGDWELDGRWQHPCEKRFDATFERRMTAAIDALAGHGTAVFVATMPYVIDDDYGHREDRRTDCLNHRIAAATAARPFAATIDLAAHVCPRGKCKTRLDGVLLRHDGQHFEGEGAELIGWWLVTQIREHPWTSLGRKN
jgi:peptidoglycan/LPS O-acetylase OafA/YrhL